MFSVQGPEGERLCVLLVSMSPGVPGGGGSVVITMDGRSRMTIDPRIPTMPGRKTAGFRRPGIHCLHQARRAGRCWADRNKIVSCILLITAFEADFLAYG